jgi:hypothetical protein
MKNITASVSGRVTNETGLPVKGAKVSAGTATAFTNAPGASINSAYAAYRVAVTQHPSAATGTFDFCSQWLTLKWLLDMLLPEYLLDITFLYTQFQCRDNLMNIFLSKKRCLFSISFCFAENSQS